MNFDTEILFKRSLEYCAEKESTTNTKDIEERIRNNNAVTNRNFRYALGKEICNCLASNYDEIESCYIFGSSLSDTARIASDIDLLIKVARKSKELKTAIAKIDRQILGYYKKNMNGDAKGLIKLLDVYFIDDIDVRNCIGFASLIFSIHTPPIKVVEKNEKNK